MVRLRDVVRVTGGGTGADGGYPNALRDGTNRVVFYSGNAKWCRVFLLNHTAG